MQPRPRGDSAEGIECAQGAKSVFVRSDFSFFVCFTRTVGKAVSHRAAARRIGVSRKGLVERKREGANPTAHKFCSTLYPQVVAPSPLVVRQKNTSVEKTIVTTGRKQTLVHAAGTPLVCVFLCTITPDCDRPWPLSVGLHFHFRFCSRKQINWSSGEV